MKFPLFISVPHSSEKIADEVKDLCILSPEDVRQDSDEQAYEIYSCLENHVIGYAMADIARAIVDLNRAPDDIGGDGLIKTKTCYDAQVYNIFPDEKLISILLEKYYWPYHEKLKNGARLPGVKLGIDCHTMATVGPAVSPDPGQKRPFICLSNGEGTCPPEWLESLAVHLKNVFNEEVAINRPFKGGYITQQHASEMPWMQLEMARTKTMLPKQKGKGLLQALEYWILDLEKNS